MARGKPTSLPPRLGSLVRKPGAFARYRFLFPTMHFRLTYDALGNGAGSVPTWSTCGSCTWRPTMEATVDSALSLLLEAGQPFDYAEVRDLAEPKVSGAGLVWEAGPESTACSVSLVVA